MNEQTKLTLMLLAVPVVLLLVFMFINSKRNSKNIEKNRDRLELLGFYASSGVAFGAYRFLVDKSNKKWLITDLQDSKIDSSVKMFDFANVKDAVFYEDDKEIISASEVEYPIFEAAKKNAALILKERNELYAEAESNDLLDKLTDDKSLQEKSKEIEKEEKEEEGPLTKDEYRKKIHDYASYEKELKEKREKEYSEDPSYKTNPFKVPVNEEGEVSKMTVKVFLDIDGEEKKMAIDLLEQPMKRKQGLYTELYRGCYKIINQFAFVLKKK